MSINLNISEEARERIAQAREQARAEYNANFEGIGDEYVVLMETYYGGDYGYGSPVRTQIRAYYKDPEDKSSGVVELKHYFHSLEIGNARKRDVLVVEEPAPNLGEIFEQVNNMDLGELPSDYSSDFPVTGRWEFHLNGGLAMKGTTDTPVAQFEQVKELFGFEEKRAKALMEIDQRVSAPEFQAATRQEMERSNAEVARHR